MPLWISILIGALVVGAVFKVIFPTESKKIGIMTKGHLNVFIKDRAQTPRGAEDIYTIAIDDAEKMYAEADNTVRQLSGRIELAKEDIRKANKEKADYETKCDALVRAGKFEEAEILAEKREVLLLQIEGYEQTIAETQPLLDDSLVVLNESKKKAEILKVRKVQVVEALKRSIEYNKIVDSVDELKKNSDVDKMIGYVDDGYRRSQEKLAGARASYNNRLETKVSKAIQTSRKTTSSSYVEELKKKYNK